MISIGFAMHLRINCLNEKFMENFQFDSFKTIYNSLLIGTRLLVLHEFLIGKKRSFDVSIANNCKKYCLNYVWPNFRIVSLTDKVIALPNKFIKFSEIYSSKRKKSSPYSISKKNV